MSDSPTTTARTPADLTSIKEAFDELLAADTAEAQEIAAMRVTSALEREGLIYVPVGQLGSDLAEDLDVRCPRVAIEIAQRATEHVSFYGDILGYCEFDDNEHDGFDEDDCLCGRCP